MSIASVHSSPTSTDSFQHFLTQLQKAARSVDLDLGVEEMADIFWLAAQSDRLPVSIPSKLAEIPPDDQNSSPSISPQKEPTVSVITDSQRNSQTETPSAYRGNALPIQITAAKALRSQLELARALRPLMRKVPSRTQWQLEEETTATQAAEYGFICPVLVPKPERWFDLAIVVEDSHSLKIWTETIAEFCTLAEVHGAFRQVKTWQFVTRSDRSFQLLPLWHQSREPQSNQSSRPLDPEALTKADDRLIWFISDCTSVLWDDSPIYRTLQKWGEKAPLVLIQLFPEKLWRRTALGLGTPLRFAASAPGLRVSDLKTIGPEETEEETSISVRFPVISLEPEPLKRWAKVTTGVPSAQVSGMNIHLSRLTPSSEAEEPLDEVDDEAKVRLFSLSASLTARKLAGLMAAAPVSLPVVHLIQKTLLPESTQIHVAEVLMSGLIRSFPVPTKPDQKEYDFLSETVRDRLSASVSIPQTLAVIQAISAQVSERLGLGTKSFRALIARSSSLETEQQTLMRPFAELALSTLKRLGTEYRQMAERLEQYLQPVPLPDNPQPGRWPPVTETFDFDFGTVEVLELTEFEFTTATIEPQPAQRNLINWIQRKDEEPKWVVTRLGGTGWKYAEPLSEGVMLEMVEITGGTFTMGASPEDEQGYEDERPPHAVTVPDFFIGKYPITQAQWKTIALCPQINRELEPDPSHFKGEVSKTSRSENRPVEQVSWEEAKEFCDRLSGLTGRIYDLPTEAQWEYACRGGTTTPYAFGDKLVPELANFDSNREGTTIVGSYPANPWGLYDMHGNVWEWCLDHWQNSYTEKPEHLKENGNIPWTTENSSTTRLLRGGSWGSTSRNCRSAYRFYNSPANRYYNIGFRVVCSGARTPA